MKRILDLIVFEHSVFALPFAIVGFVVAQSKGALVQHHSSLILLALVVVAAVSARTAAMAFNRIADLKFDRENPRTSARELVSGVVKKNEAYLLVIGASLLFFASSALLGRHCLVLAPAVLALLFGYSFTKRFTNFSHLVLGVALALAPGGAWWVLRPVVEIEPLALMAGVLFWVAGFDIIYASQDAEFDRKGGLYSIPSWLGVGRGLQLARIFHLISGACFLLFGVLCGFGSGYFWGLLPVGLAFLYQHSLVRESDLSRVKRAFFTVNGWVSVYYLALVILLSW